MLVAETIYNLTRELNSKEIERLCTMLERDRQPRTTASANKKQLFEQKVGERVDVLLRKLQDRNIKKPGASV